MHRRIAAPNQLPTEGEFMEAQRFAYSAMGHFFHDVLGPPPAVGAWVFGFACAQTTVASLSFLLGPGKLYAPELLDLTPMGQIDGAGGLNADTNVDHKIFKQGLWEDTATLGPLAPPVTAGQSQVFLVEAQFDTQDDVPVLTEFYNTAAPDTPISAEQSLYRRDLVAIQIKAGAAAATGSQAAPAVDAGWVPLWTITLANGDTTITAGKIAVAPGAPFINLKQPTPVIEPIATVGDASGMGTLVAGVLTIDCLKGNYLKVPMTANITSVVFNNAPASGFGEQITVEFIGDGTARTLTFLAQASIKWAGVAGAGAAPTFTTTANYKNRVVFSIRDGLATQDASWIGTTAP